MVSDSQFERALADPDNRNILEAVSKRFRQGLTPGERRSACLLALWRALQGHRDGMGNKFTTSLHQFASWELSTEARRAARWRRQSGRGEDAEPAERAPRIDPEDLEHVMTRLSVLPENQREVFLNRLSGMRVTEIARVAGCTRTTASTWLNAAIRTLMAVCGDGVVDEG